MSAKRLDGKVAVITGASKGLGKAMAQALGRAGAKLALVARNREQLDALATEIQGSGGEARAFEVDVTNEDQVVQLERDVHAAFGKASILINNAGINIRKPLADYTLAEWNRVLNTNLTSVFMMCHAFIPHMKGAGYGRIVNIASTMAHVSLAGRSAYSASKAALLGVTRALALELATEKITVNAICPGPFATEMNTVLMQNPEVNQQFLLKTPIGRWGKVEEVGQLALYLCSEDAGFITGTDVVIDGGWCAQ